MTLLALTAFVLLLLAACSSPAVDLASAPLPTAISPLPSPTLMPSPTESPSAPESLAASSRRPEAPTTPQARLMQTPVPKGQRVEIDGRVYESDGELLQPVQPAAGQGGSELERVALAARQLAAAQLKIAADTVLVRQIEPVTWPDASLGCPQEGYLYAQVLTPGYKVMIKASDATYELHLDANGNGGFCPPVE